MKKKSSETMNSKKEIDIAGDDNLYIDAEESEIETDLTKDNHKITIRKVLIFMIKLQLFVFFLQALFLLANAKEIYALYNEYQYIDGLLQKINAGIVPSLECAKVGTSLKKFQSDCKIEISKATINGKTIINEFSKDSWIEYSIGSISVKFLNGYMESVWISNNNFTPKELLEMFNIRSKTEKYELVFDENNRLSAIIINSPIRHKIKSSKIKPSFPATKVSIDGPIDYLQKLKKYALEKKLSPYLCGKLENSTISNIYEECGPYPAYHKFDEFNEHVINYSDQDMSLTYFFYSGHLLVMRLEGDFPFNLQQVFEAYGKPYLFADSKEDAHGIVIDDNTKIAHYKFGDAKIAFGFNRTLHDKCTIIYVYTDFEDERELWDLGQWGWVYG